MRELVDHLRICFRVSVRRVFRAVPALRSTFHCRSHRPGQAILRQRVRELAETRARCGYRRIHAEPFFTTKPRGKGTGLGLAMARGFAKQSGGDLLVESAPGRGTQVSLWFPVAEVVPAREAEATSRAVEPGRPHRILLVDDEALVREITAQGLEESGFSVLAAESGGAALTLLDAGEAVDLIISDLSMPEMDGLMVIREAQRRRPGLAAILLTGFATNAAELAVSGAVSGAFSLLRKPVTGPQLAERISVLLAGAEMRPG